MDFPPLNYNIGPDIPRFKFGGRSEGSIVDHPAPFTFVSRNCEMRSYLNRAKTRKTEFKMI